MHLKFWGVCAVMCLAAGSTSALTSYGNVTPSLIFGSGNANGGFTIDTQNNVEIGLRGKLRFNSLGDPENTFNGGVDSNIYTFKAGAAPGGYGFAFNSPTTPVWSFEWSINTNADGLGSLNLDDLTYVLSLDGDPTNGISSALEFDPINVTSADHTFGTNATGNGGGTKGVRGTTQPAFDAYANLIAANNLAQQSWNYEFFNDPADFPGTALEFFNPNAVGTYTISLAAFDGGNQVAKSEIQINVVPVPGALPLLASMAVLGIGAARLRKRRNA